MKTSLIAAHCAALFISGCAITLPGGGGFTDATAPVGQRQYTTVGPAEATVMSTIFLKQFGSPDIEKAKQMAVASVDGDELIGVIWEVEHRNYFLFRKLGVTVRGTAIKFTDGQTVRNVRGVAPVSDLPVKRDHRVTLALGALSGGRTYQSYDFHTGRWVKREFDYGTGWSIAYKPRQQNKQWYFAPSVAVTSLDDLTSIAIMQNLVLALDEYIPIPLGSLTPYAEVGLGYTPIVWPHGADMEWAVFGWNAGIGATLSISPGFALDFSANRQASIGGFGLHWWPGNGFNQYEADLTSDPHFWRFGVGLVLRR
ncbi:hypothetical protein KKF64_00145 [Patescibacteria group bacterium]|nr:hypothetical protein [Patescibacteria group bacterium]